MNKVASHWNYATIYWTVWFLVLFLIPELYWVFKAPGNTLSWQVWHLEQGRMGTYWTFTRYLFGAGSLWLFFHLTFGWFG